MSNREQQLWTMQATGESASGGPAIFDTTPAVSEIDLSDCFGGDGDKIHEELRAFFYDGHGKLMGASQGG